jgi:hypothetical protein
VEITLRDESWIDLSCLRWDYAVSISPEVCSLPPLPSFSIINYELIKTFGSSFKRGAELHAASTLLVINLEIRETVYLPLCVVCEARARFNMFYSEGFSLP